MLQLSSETNIYSGTTDNFITLTAPQTRASISLKRVTSFKELLACLAKIQFRNRNCELLYRGQTEDYKARPDSPPESGSSVYPSIFRNTGKVMENGIVATIKDRFEKLNVACNSLKKNTKNSFPELATMIYRSDQLQWALLQHYEVCETPLLDVTPSLHVALTFAKRSKKTSPVLVVLAVPPTNGVVSTAAHEGIQTIRLAQFCPPNFQRPHFQEGYLLGEYPPIPNYDTKVETRGSYNFSHRLICKFELHGISNWNDFNAIPTTILLPEETSSVTDLFKQIKEDTG